MSLTPDAVQGTYIAGRFYNKVKSKMPPPTKRRRTEPTAVEEINFDPAARQEYLTGFHKRKLQRAKHAQEAAEKRAREEKIEARKKVQSQPSFRSYGAPALC